MALIRSTTIHAAADERRGERDPAALVRNLGDPDPTTRRWAARELGAEASASEALIALALIETDVSVREVALSSLTRIGDAKAVAGLIDCLRSEDTGLRNDAIEAMKCLPVEVAPIMRDLLADADPDVRILAINVLESLRHAQVEGWLIEVIAAETQVNVCGAAVDLLTEVATPRALPALESVRARFADEPYLQFAVGLALQRIESSSTS